MSMAKEFKDFINRGNVVDLAVGIVMGAAFGAIVKSFVDDIIMPPIGSIISGVDFSSLKIQLGGPDGKASIKYGAFLQAIINFLIIAFCVFQVVKVMNKLKGPPPAPKKPEPTPTELLLTEIRDELKKK
ncbi:large-conductance mechanosensitive channel protein MscL [Telmatocola sphagniphila]|nr:large-conductance mechanosensitive channel protein MscL [Telmatocola sphagniphila]